MLLYVVCIWFSALSYESEYLKKNEKIYGRSGITKTDVNRIISFTFFSYKLLLYEPVLLTS